MSRMKKKMYVWWSLKKVCISLPGRAEWVLLDLKDYRAFTRAEEYPGWVSEPPRCLKGVAVGLLCWLTGVSEEDCSDEVRGHMCDVSQVWSHLDVRSCHLSWEKNSSGNQISLRNIPSKQGCFPIIGLLGGSLWLCEFSFSQYEKRCKLFTKCTDQGLSSASLLAKCCCRPWGLPESPSFRLSLVHPTLWFWILYGMKASKISDDIDVWNQGIWSPNTSP